jgi:hypothetical protein
VGDPPWARLGNLKSAIDKPERETILPSTHSLIMGSAAVDEHLTTDQKGEIALLKVRIEASRKGAVVALPTIPARYDCILDYQGKLYRVQVKYADSKMSHSQGATRLDLRRRKRI